MHACRLSLSAQRVPNSQQFLRSITDVPAWPDGHQGSGVIYGGATGRPGSVFANTRPNPQERNLLAAEGPFVFPDQCRCLGGCTGFFCFYRSYSHRATDDRGYQQDGGGTTWCRSDQCIYSGCQHGYRSGAQHRGGSS